MIHIKWILFFIVIAVLIIGAIDAYAVELVNNAVGIAFSKTYITQLMIDPNLHPNYDDLLSLNLDNSNRRITGDFIIKDGITQRDHPPVINHWRFYKYSTDYLIIIDPPSDMRNKLKMIFIESNFNTYLTSADMIKENNTRTIHKDRFVDSKCSNATINTKTWITTIADSIHFLRQNCDPKFTTLKTIDTITDDTTIQDIASSQKYKEEQWKKEIKQTHIEYKIGKDNSTNRSVTEDKDPKYVPPKTPPFDYTSVR